MVKAGEVVAEISVEHPVHLLAARSRQRAHPTRDAGCAPAGTRTRSRGSPSRRWRSAPRPPPAEGSCPPARRPRAAAAARLASVCTPSATASPGSARCEPEHGDPEGCPRDPARSPPTSRRPPPARPSAEAPKYAARRRSTSTWCRSAVNRASLSVAATRRTRSKPTERALPGTGSGARFAGRVPLGRSASLHRLRRPALGVVRQLLRYYRTVRLLTIVHHGITASAFPARPAPTITTGG